MTIAISSQIYVPTVSVSTVTTTILSVPIVADSVTIIDNQAAPTTWTDNGAGVLTPTGGTVGGTSGTVDYVTGDVSLLYSAPPTITQLQITYIYNNPPMDIIIRVEKTGTIKDTPRGEKNILSPKYNDGFIPKPIRAQDPVPSVVVELLKTSQENELNRFEKLKLDNQRVIAGANYALDLISEKMKSKIITVDPNTHPEIIAALNQLYGDNGHGNRITFAMYLDLMNFIYEYGRHKAFSGA